MPVVNGRNLTRILASAFAGNTDTRAEWRAYHVEIIVKWILYIHYQAVIQARS